MPRRPLRPPPVDAPHQRTAPVRPPRAPGEPPTILPGRAARAAALAPVPRPPARSSRPDAGYLPALDGLRAVAVAAVVAYHLGELPGGFLGVDVFFAISGFLITRLLLAEHASSGAIALRSFWARRFRRLLPALLVVVVAVMVGSRAWLPAWRLGDIRTDALAAIAYVANWRFVVSGQSYFQSGVVPSPLRHTWSLSIEEQYYLVWPLVVVGLARARRVPLRRIVAMASLAGAVASGAWMAVAAGQGRDLSRIYYGTDTRAFALFAGAWLATWWHPMRPRPGSGAARFERLGAVVGAFAVVPVLVLFAVAATDEAGTYRGTFQAMALLSVLLVAGAATGLGPLNRVLASRPLVWVGRRSYGIYLWSWPVQVFAAEGFGSDGIALDAVVVSAAVTLAALSHWLVEEPIRAGRRPAGLPALAEPSPRRLRPALSFGAVGVVVAVVVAAAIGAPPAPDYTRVSDEEALEAALAGAEADAPTTTAPPPVDEGPPGPFSGLAGVDADPAAQVDPTTAFGRPLKVMIAGDSVGWSLGWRLADGFPASIELTDRAIIGCGLMPRTAEFVVHGRAPERYGDLCLEVAAAERAGLAWGPDVVLLWVGAWEVYDHEVDGRRLRVGTQAYADVLDEQIQQRVDWYRALGIPTIIARVTCFGPNASRLGDERHDPERLAWVNERIEAAARRNRGWVRTIDPTDTLCDAEGEARPSTPDGLELRADGAHFDPETAVWFWNAWLAGQLGSVMADAASSGRAAAATAADETPSVLGESSPPQVTGGG